MQLPMLTHEENEALCRRCGVSCHLSIEVGPDKYVIEELHCRFLARESDGRYSCTVYEKRFEMAPWCHTAEDAAKTGNLSTNCLYASYIPNFKGREWASPELRKKLLPIVRQKFIADGLPLSGNPDSALKVLTAEGELWTYTQQADRFVFQRIG